MWRLIVAVAGLISTRAALNPGPQGPQHKVDFDRDDEKWALHVALIADNATSVRGLLRAGYDPNLKSPEYGYAPLHYAAGPEGNAKMAALLLEYGANPNVRESYKQITVLQMAVENEKYDVARALLENGANPNLATDDGDVPLHSAASLGNVMLADLLLKYDADVDVRMHENAVTVQKELAGKSPLHLAVWFKRMDVIAALTKHGANWDLQDVDGLSPANMGATYGFSRDQFVPSAEDRDSRRRSKQARSKRSTPREADAEADNGAAALAVGDRIVVTAGGEKGRHGRVVLVSFDDTSIRAKAATREKYNEELAGRVAIRLDGKQDLHVVARDSLEPEPDLSDLRRPFTPEEAERHGKNDWPSRREWVRSLELLEQMKDAVPKPPADYPPELKAFLRKGKRAPMMQMMLDAAEDQGVRMAYPRFDSRGMPIFGNKPGSMDTPPWIDPSRGGSSAAFQEYQRSQERGRSSLEDTIARWEYRAWEEDAGHSEL